MLEKIELTLNVNYLPEWKTWSGIRELVQNAKDAETEFGAKWGISQEGDTLTIWNDKVVLDHDVLLFGTSSKKNNDTLIGQFGEGLKLGTLALIREGKQVLIHTGKEIWTPRIEKSSKFGCNILVFLIEPATEAFKGVRIQISPISRNTWGRYKNRFLFLSPKYEHHGYAGDEVLLSPGMAGKIFSKGIFVCTDKRYKYGYNLRHLPVDRDRKMASAQLLNSHIFSLWQDLVSNEQTLAPLLYDLLAGDTEDTSVVIWTQWFGLKMRQALAGVFSDRHGQDAVPVFNDLARKELEHFSTRAVVVPNRLHKILEVEFGTLNQVKERVRREIRGEVSDRDLTVNEKENVSYTVNLLRKIGEDPTFIVVEFKTGDILGLYDNGTIKIARWVLKDRCRLLATLIHEVAHRHGGDGSHSHVQAMEIIWSNVTKHFMLRVKEL